MASKLLISVSATQVCAARWQGGRFATCSVFDNSEEGLSAFQEYLAQIRNLSVHMMVDAVEEDYRIELLPHAYGSERSESREAGKRRDDRYLFCALTNPELIAAWVEAIIERGLPIAGIYLLPTVSQGLVEKLEIDQTNLLVVSIHSS